MNRFIRARVVQDLRSASAPSIDSCTQDLIDLAWLGINLCRTGMWKEGLPNLLFSVNKFGAKAHRRLPSYTLESARAPANSPPIAPGPPTLAWSYLGYGIASLEGKQSEGLALCQRALRAEPSEPENYLNLARTHLLAEQRRLAIEALDRGLEIDPDHQQLLRVRGGLGWRKRVPLPVLPRDHFLNRLLARPRRGPGGQRERERLALELRSAREDQYRFATRDTVTGAYNRTFLLNSLTLSVAHAQRTKQRVAVLFIDLDGFRAVNASGGHSLGDALLKSVAERLSGSIREMDLVARVGDDEFVVVLQDMRDSGHLATFVDLILEGFEKPFSVDGRDYWLAASAGVAIAPHQGTTPELLLRNAETALHQGEIRGRSSCQFFSDIVSHRMKRRQDLETCLREALEGDQFSLHYQPIHDTRTLKLAGAEALLRWQSPTLGSVSPSQFIPIAEETGLILPLGEWVLRTACEQWRLWHSEGSVEVPLSVNVSGHQLNYPARVARIAEILQEVGMNPSMLRLEITERTIMQDDATTIAALEVLKGMGVGLSLDDFGTGYSSITLLRSVPVDYVKIGDSYVDDVRANLEGSALVAAIIAMAHRLNLKVVAEGVESRAQLQFLAHEECDQIQGHIMSPALSAEDFERYLQMTPDDSLLALSAGPD